MYPSTDELVEKLGQWKKGKESSLWSVAVEYDQTGLGLAREEMVRLQAEIDAINYAIEHPKWPSSLKRNGNDQTHPII